MSRIRREGWWARASESLASRLWPVPLAAVIVAVAAGVLLPRLDAVIDSDLGAAVDAAVFDGGADTARSVLSSIAGSLITATSLTFSLTVVALQLASSQASPRVLRLFARDRQVHWTLAAFLGTFAYSITVLRSVRSATEDIPEAVPRVSVTIAFVLTLVSVLMLVVFLGHLAAQLRVETMLKDIHADTDRTIELLGRRNASARAFVGSIHIPESCAVVSCESSGFVTAHHHASLLRSADEHSIVIQELRRVGDNVVAGTPLARWWSSAGDDGAPGSDHAAIDAAIRKGYSIGYERTAAEDVGYGVEQIVDIGLRALSPGVNDPTTAVHALGHLAALLTRIVSMPRLPQGMAGEDEALRLVTASSSLSQDIDAALAPLRQYGADHAAVVTRFVRLADELAASASDDQVDRVLVSQLEALARQLRLQEADPATRDDLLVVVETTAVRIRERAGGADR